MPPPLAQIKWTIIQVAILMSTLSFAMAYQSYSGGFSHQAILPFFKENTFYAFRTITQFQLCTVSIAYITDSKPFLQKTWGSKVHLVYIYIKVQELSEHTGRDPHDSCMGLWPSMYRRREWEIKAINYQEAPFAWKGRNLMGGSSNTVPTQWWDCRDREKKDDIH